jgi:hypothetical protein
MGGLPFPKVRPEFLAFARPIGRSGCKPLCDYVGRSVGLIVCDTKQCIIIMIMLNRNASDTNQSVGQSIYLKAVRSALREVSRMH